MSKHSFIDEAVSRMEGSHEFDIIVTHGNITEEEEQRIYSMHDEGDQNCGPIYTKPPAKEQEIFEAFKGKNVNILYHKDVR